jgi:hypothetical protein
MPKTLLEKLQAVLGGPITAYDGQFVVWYKVEHPNMQYGSQDLRDVAPKIKGATLKSLREIIPTFERTKRGKVAATETEE